MCSPNHFKIQDMPNKTIGDLIRDRGLKITWVHKQLNKKGVKYFSNIFYRICRGEMVPKKDGFAKAMSQILNCDQDLIESITVKRKSVKDE